MRNGLVLLAGLLLAGMVYGQEAKAERVIAVAGTATVYAKPDTARINYGVRATEPSVDAVKDVLGKTTKAIEDATKKLKLSSLTISHAPVGIKQSNGNNGINGGPVPLAPGGAPAPANPGLGPFLGCTSHTATIVNSDPEKLRADVDAFLKAIVEAGANTNGGDAPETNIDIFPGRMANDGPKVVLSRGDDSAARDEAFQKAVEKAVRNAKAIAKALGAMDVKVISVTDEPEKPTPEPVLMYAFESPTAVRSPAGEVEVKVRVVVKCTY